MNYTIRPMNAEHAKSIVIANSWHHEAKEALTEIALICERDKLLKKIKTPLASDQRRNLKPNLTKGIL